MTITAAWRGAELLARLAALPSAPPPAELERRRTPAARLWRDAWLALCVRELRMSARELELAFGIDRRITRRACERVSLTTTRALAQEVGLRAKFQVRKTRGQSDNGQKRRAKTR